MCRDEKVLELMLTWLNAITIIAMMTVPILAILSM